MVLKRSRGFSPWSFPAAWLTARRLSWLASVHVCAFATYPILYWSGTLHYACKWPSLSWLRLRPSIKDLPCFKCFEKGYLARDCPNQ